MYIKFEFYILPPPPSWFIFLPQHKYIITRVCAPKNFQPFFCNFYILKSIGEKICILFTNFGKNMHFPPFQSFFFTNLLFGHIFAHPPGGSNRIIYTPVKTYNRPFVSIKISGPQINNKHTYYIYIYYIYLSIYLGDWSEGNLS